MAVCLVLAYCLSPACVAAGAPASTFGTTIGSGLLCLDQIDPFFFWSYLKESFGVPYKQESGAYWFKVQTSLWGMQVSDILVSDGSGQLVFLAATFKAKPDALSDAILGSTGIGYMKDGAMRYSPLESGLGSRIVYAGQDSRIYCAKYNPDSWR